MGHMYRRVHVLRGQDGRSVGPKGITSILRSGVSVELVRRGDHKIADVQDQLPQKLLTLARETLSAMPCAPLPGGKRSAGATR